ncbi:SPATS2-like protein [Varanus komodoensis]|nr:SPATS2-like protein [Varanus komodoensis]
MEGSWRRASAANLKGREGTYGRKHSLSIIIVPPAVAQFKLEMAEITSQTNIKEKISAVRSIVPNKSNNEIVLVLQQFDNNVDKAVQAFMDGSALQVLKEWNMTGKKKQAMTDTWQFPNQPHPTSQQFEPMYKVQEQNILSLLKHPKLNLIVESSQGREHKEHSTPRDKEECEINMMSYCICATTGLGLRISNYDAMMARYQYFLMQRLESITSSLLEQQRDLAHVFICKAMQVAIQ